MSICVSILHIHKVNVAIHDTTTKSPLSTDSPDQSPTLNPIPKHSPYQIKSGDHLDIDECNRLWILDQANAQLILIDLVQMAILKEEKILVNGELIPTHGLIVDVNATTCDRAYVYLPAFLKFGFVVYSLSEDQFWMLYNPRSSSIKITATLAPPSQRVYVQDIFSTNLYTVQTRNLKEGKYFPEGECERFYSLGGGRRNLDTLTDVICFDKRSGILLYYAHTPQLTSRIGCWNTKKFPELYSKNTTAEISIREIMVSEEFVIDMMVDDSSNLWIMRKEEVSEDPWDKSSISFVTYSIKVEELVKGTICA